MMAGHVAQGEGLEPHNSNPLSVQEDVEAAMKSAQEKAQEETDKVEKDMAEGGEPEVLDFNKAKEAAKPVEAEAEPAAEPEPEQEDDQPGDLQPPAAWSAEDQDVFRSVPKHVQEWLSGIHERDAARYQEQSTQLQPMQRIYDQWQPYAQQTGIPLDQAINQVLQTEMILRTGTDQQKREVIGNLINSYGVDLGQAQAKAPDGLADDPVYGAMAPQLQQIMQGLQSLESRVNNQFSTLQASQEQQQNAALQAFADERDDKGQLLRPYYAEVKPLMEQLADVAQKAGQQPSLQEVYDQACRASPTVWPKIQSQLKATDLASRQQQAAEKKRAASSVSSSPSGKRVLKDDNPDESTYDTVMRAMQAHGGAG